MLGAPRDLGLRTPLIKGTAGSMRAGVLMPLTGQGIKLLHNSALYALNYSYPRLH